MDPLQRVEHRAGIGQQEGRPGRHGEPHRDRQSSRPERAEGVHVGPVVADVERYPQFLPLCEGLNVCSRAQHDGDTVLVGAYVDNGIYPGYAYVFTRSKTGWKQGAKLIPSDGVPNDYFGNGVSAHGNTAMVGAPGLNEMVGSVYEYHLDGKAGN